MFQLECIGTERIPPRRLLHWQRHRKANMGQGSTEEIMLRRMPIE